jgi:formiminotetrahydrofolate cyclodeaminase
MPDAQPEPAPTDVRDVSVVEVLEAIGSPEPSSAAGISAGIALALATACMLKAVSVTLKHLDDPALRAHHERLLEQRDRALERAREDAQLFQSYLRDHAPRDAAKLVHAAEKFQELADEVAEGIDALEGKVRRTVAADLVAARALHSAAMAIEALVMRDNRRLRARAVR